MAKYRFTMYIPVMVVLALSIPLISMGIWSDMEYSREMADSVKESDSKFRGFTDNSDISVNIVPTSVVDENVKDSTEKVNVTDSSGNTSVIEQDTAKGELIQGLLDAAIMVGLAVVAAFVIYKLFIKGKKFTLKVFFTVALGLCASISIFLYLYLFRDFLLETTGFEVARNWIFYVSTLTVGFVIGSFMVYNMVYKSLVPKRKNPALIAFCILMGAFLSIVLPIWALIPLITGVALWDLWAAKRGIIKDMITHSDEERDNILKERKKREAIKHTHNPEVRHVTGAVPEEGPPNLSVQKKRSMFEVAPGEDITSYGLYEGKYYSLGLGDFIFFSVIVGTTFKWLMLKLPWAGFYNFGWGEALAILGTVIVAELVLLGLKKTLGYLDKEKVMPGLPLSVLYGLIGFFAIGIGLEVLNLVITGQFFQPF